MQFYVPEIGDEIILTEDWVFPLHAEYRNETMGTLHNHYLLGQNWIDRAVHPQLPEANYDVKYPTEEDVDREHKVLFGSSRYDVRERLIKEAQDNCPEYVKYWAEYKAWFEEGKKHYNDAITITIPAGQKLKIDRIYIRKGISDYSSITFYAKGLGTVVSGGRWGGKKSNKAIRFWAKLSDCNNIKFEKDAK